MLKKIVYALALTGLASGQAFALNNPGFETGDTTGWTPIIPTSGMTVVGYGTPGATVNVVDDVYVLNSSNVPVPTVVYSEAVTPVSAADLPGSTGVGNYFALLSTCPASTAALDCTSASTYTFNLSGPVSSYGDYFLARLFTADFFHNYNDTVTITYSGVGVSGVSDVISVQSMNPTESSGVYESGWMAFAVPVGTQNIFVQVDNVAIVPFGGDPKDSLYNRPIVAIDYAAAVTPVPEADASAMMLAGLGVLGLMARRRTKKAA